MLISYSFFSVGKHHCTERCLHAYTISDINETSTKELKWAWNYVDQICHGQEQRVDCEERAAVIATFSKQLTCALRPSAGILCSLKLSYE